MACERYYKDYFNIDPKYYAAVTADLIREGKVDWKSFYPHETFVKLLEKTHMVLSGMEPKSLWVEGAYGTGKSHAALTVKCLLEAPDEEVQEYFKDYGLSIDLCNKLIADKNNGKLITVHRVGSSAIHSDQDLIYAVQSSIMLALEKHGIENKGEASLSTAALRWLEDKEANRIYFNSLIQEQKYAWDFAGDTVDDVIKKLKSGDAEEVASTMRNIMKVAADNNIDAMRMDMNDMSKWIKNIIAENSLSAILFIWDEFSEYFLNNPNSLTGFQTLVEISESQPFYLMIVCHESGALIKDPTIRNKILGRFVTPTCKIELPDNMAFRLMAKAMKTTNDPVVLQEWQEMRAELNDNLGSVRSTIISSLKKNSRLGEKTLLTDGDLAGVIPIHPYAALLLKHMSVAFSSNQRSMFDFIISPDMTDAKGFKWFISTHCPTDDENLLTIDLLWDFFLGKGESGLSSDVRVVLDSYDLVRSDRLTPDERRVFKTVLLLEAISLRVANVELLRPNQQNVDLAFAGTDWPKGKGGSIAQKLVNDGILFTRSVGGGMSEYTVANSAGDTAKVKQIKEDIQKNLRTQELLVNAELTSAVQLPAAIRNRFVLEAACAGNFTSKMNDLERITKSNRLKVVCTFAMNDDEATTIRSYIAKRMATSQNDVFFIESLVPMGKDLVEQYVDSMTYSQYYRQSDRSKAASYQNEALRRLLDWKHKVSTGAFMLYTKDAPSGLRMADLNALQQELLRIDRQEYPDGLEQYNLIDNMFNKGPLAQGAECGIDQVLSGTFKSSNARTSLATALSGVWNLQRDDETYKYWEDSSLMSLSVVRAKKAVEDLVQKSFASPSGRVSLLAIFNELENAPYGYMPSNVAAFMMGFLLKEYANSNYFWSNGSNSEAMSVDKMKTAIANAINQVATPSSKYKEEYIVAMSAEQRAFLNCTAAAFHISQAQCGSIEQARNEIRVKMKGLDFPIWCIKSILGTDQVRTESSVEELAQVITDYCGIANNANGGCASESELADAIGKKVLAVPSIAADLEHLLSSEYTRKGMMAYITNYQNGELVQLANDINDGGAYLDQVKKKFNADDANWVWNPVTADEKISDAILEYKIVAETNKSMPGNHNLKDAITEWNRRTNNIKIPYDVLRKITGDLEPLLEQLRNMKQSGMLLEQNRQKFLDVLQTQRENFDKFYPINAQVRYFKEACSAFLDGMDDMDIVSFFAELPSNQFLKSSSEYYNFIQKEAADFLAKQQGKRLKDMWIQKTGTKDPRSWSTTFNTPILCMFDDNDRAEAKQMFAIIQKNSPTEAEANKALAYLDKATFYDRLNDAAERDRCFKARVIGTYSTLLPDVDEVRNKLLGLVTEDAYYWIDNQTVQNKLKQMADQKYKTGGSDRAMSVIDRLDADQLRKYLRNLVADNMVVGMEILKNE